MTTTFTINKDYVCGECGHPLYSTYEGEFVSCPKHPENFVDQTAYYQRWGGSVVHKDKWEEYFGKSPF